MSSKILKPKQALNKAFLKVKPNRSEIEAFKINLTKLIDHSNEVESEEFHKNLVIDFLKKTYYDPNHYINTKGRNDLVIHTGDKAKSSVGVIIEAKKPTNKSEMLNQSNINYKAFQELVLYYLRERITHKNLEVKHLIVTNINEWFIFDAQTFDRHFAQNKGLVKQFEDFEGGRLSEVKTDFFYKHIAEPEIEKVKAQIDFTYFDIRSYDKPLRNSDKKDDAKLIALYKLLSPEHLLKLPFANDSNSLDKRFYSELLHIIGLTESKEGGKKLIGRSKAGERNSGSILEDAIIQLDSLDKLGQLEKPSQYGNTSEERLFNVGLELSITWINRVLFLKLLEAQLITYHNLSRDGGKGDTSYAFLNKNNIHDWDDLNSLFFQVLAKRTENRNEDVKALFAKVPYLNSSLFEPTAMEQRTIMINFLKNEKTIPVISSTVLKNEQGKKLTGSLTTLDYLFKFLDAYDFASEGSEEIQEDNKTLINASVLGLIFEKINGYKDGSFFTPGFITMYMCRETIRRAVLQKFKEAVNNLTPNPSPLRRGESTQIKLGVEKIDPTLLENAREMRKNPTKAEDFLWQLVRNRRLLGYKFRRQHPVDQKFVLDFFCNELMLGIELDGGYYWDIGQKEYDEGRSYELNELGITILRFSNEEAIWETEKIFEAVKLHSESIHPFLGEKSSSLSFGRGTEGEGQRLREINSLEDVYDIIGPNELLSYEAANTLVNSIKICDPAVGSGHFLVSALNEIIAVKNDLKILQDRSGKRLKEYQVEVVNDELIVTDEDGELFEYHPTNKESQRIQETLFHEKQTIIESCLFGVDINPNSVKICRLRLWIELLKSAYYKSPSLQTSLPEGERLTSSSPLGEAGERELETLPNIDINIKCGNSLVSRFALDEDLSQALKKSKFTIDSYRIAVDRYRNAESKEEKREMESLINSIKSDFRSEIAKNDPKIKKKAALGGELYNLTMQTGLFEESPKDKKVRLARVEKVSSELNKLESEIEKIKANQIFENAFEWRFEFPEVLNDAGEFIGFDVVIGNPPYIRVQHLDHNIIDYYKSNYKSFFQKADIYLLFIENGISLLKDGCGLSFINPTLFMSSDYGQGLRELLTQYQVSRIVDFGDLAIFEEAITYTGIFFINKCKPTNIEFKKIDSLVNIAELINESVYDTFDQNNFGKENWVLKNDRHNRLITKIQKFRNLGNLSTINSGCFTGYDKAFFVDDKTIQDFQLEEEIIKPVIMGKEPKKYNLKNPIKKCIYPYQMGINNGTEIIDEELFKTSYPNCYNHLISFKDDLENRMDSRKTFKEMGRKWYSYTRKGLIDIFNETKILVGYIVSKNTYCIDEFGYMFSVGRVFAIQPNNKQLNSTILAILNSKISEFLMTSLCPIKQGGFYKISSQYLNSFPIPNLDTKNVLEINSLVNEILKIKKQNSLADVGDFETEIDQLVYELYGLSEEEVEIVEGGINE